MTVADSMPVQIAVYDALRGALPVSVPIYDSVRANPPALFVRLDGWGVVDVSHKNCERGRHTCYVRVFQRPVGEAAHAIGQQTIKDLQVLIVAALTDLKPIPSAHHATIKHRETTVDTSADGLTGDGLSRFQITL